MLLQFAMLAMFYAVDTFGYVTAVILPLIVLIVLVRAIDSLVRQQRRGKSQEN
jgi:hypothetical protein